MAVYKIPQDVEADDKFVGPLSFKQFIFCGVGVIACYLTFLSLTKGFWPALVIFIPIIIVTGFLGFPWGRDQPTEIWLAARIRFFIKPRVRIWNQSGIKDLVTVTAPKHIERHYTNGLSQTEVTSRLSGLADLLDSRGWAVKNVNVNLYSNPLQNAIDPDDDDRLLAMTELPQEVVDVTANDDVLDEANNPTAQHFEEMIKTSEEKHRQGIMDQLQAARSEPELPEPVLANGAPQPSQAADFWFLQQGAHDGQHQNSAQIQDAIRHSSTPVDPGFTTFQTPSMVAPNATAPVPNAAVEAPLAAQVSAVDEQALLAKLHREQAEPHNPFGHIKTIMPLGSTPAPAPQPTATDQPDPTQQDPTQQDFNEPPVNMPMPQTTMPEPPMQAPIAPVTAPVNPAILNLAKNDDLNVETLARQAHKADEQRLSDDEIVISLR